MNYMSSISNITSNVSSSVEQQTMAALQAQLSLFAQSANGQNLPARADYKALQSAITSGNVSQAQAALTKLQRDAKAASPSPATSAASPPVDSDGDHDGSQDAVKSSTAHPLDTTA
jgi:hypothetical protein